jgi:N-acetylneuraminic acid mutarotase
MRKSCLVLTLLLCCALSLGTAACSGEVTTTTTAVSTTGDPIDLTIAPAETTTTTTLAPATWTSLTPTGDPPPARLGGSMVYIPSASKLLLFGGWAGGTTYINSMWGYDLAANTWADLTTGRTKQGTLVATGPLPAARATQAMVYDPSTGKVMVFGGFDGTSYYNDTWAFDPATNVWTKLSPAGSVPGARAGHSLVYDSNSAKMILFGGWNGSDELNDTWAYDPATNTWTNLRPTGRIPTARDSQAMAYDPDSKVMILFGGWSSLKEYNDTWVYDPAANTWTDLEPAGTVPSARALQQMVYDPVVKKMTLFGGGTNTTVHDDTWTYDFASNTWTETTLTGAAPYARTGCALAYDSDKRNVLLFGGSNGIAYFNDLWSLSR